jgi:hypothetical protein
MTAIIDPKFGQINALFSLTVGLTVVGRSDDIQPLSAWFPITRSNSK